MGFIDETWRLSVGDRERIADKLGVKDERGRGQALREIEKAAQLYRSLLVEQEGRPRPAEVRPKVEQIADACFGLRNLLENLGADESAHDYIEESYEVVAGNLGPPYSSLGDLKQLVSFLGLAAGRFQARGRPRDEALGVFVNQLALIWERAHGKFPGRAYLISEVGPFREFVAA